MDINDEVYAVDGGYALVRRGRITGITSIYNSRDSKFDILYIVTYNDSSNLPFIAYPEWSRHTTNELFANKDQAIAYAEYLRRGV